MMIGVLTLARPHSAWLICVPVLAVTVAPPAPPVVARPNPTGEPPLLLLDDPLTVMLNACVELVPQLFRYVAVAEQEDVGLTVCVREVPEVPHPLHDQVPPEDGVGAKATDWPDVIVALAVCVPLMNGTMAVAGQVDVLTVMLWTRVELVPQLLTYVAVAEQDAVGKTVCVLALPAVPQPLQDQLPPDVGVGAKTTCAPDATVALAVEAPLMTAPMVVAGQVGGVTTAP